MPFGEDLALGVIPSIGSLGAAAIQRNWALKDWNRVNEYNHPKNQVKRNTEAGLPLAAMFARGGSTSSDVRSTQVDPTLGTGKGLEAFMSNRLQRKQLQLMDENIGEAEANKVIAQVAANKAMDEEQYYREPLYDNTGNIRPGNRRTDSLALSMREQEAKTKTQEVIARLQEAKTQADIDHILQTIGLGQQQYMHNQIMQRIDHWIQNRLNKNGIKPLEAMFYKFFLK